jgi:hypothetical protein
MYFTLTGDIAGMHAVLLRFSVLNSVIVHKEVNANVGILLIQYSMVGRFERTDNDSVNDFCYR